MNYQSIQQKIAKRKARQPYIFALQMLGIFAITFSVLYYFGFVPEQLKNNPQVADSDPSDSSDLYPNDDAPIDDSPNTSTTPTRITIAAIGVNSVITHPASADVATLDEYLKQGAVYYPGSGTIEQGNIFLFGHSTNWKVVNNQAYKTFNGLDKLKTGDEIILKADNKEYIYVVDKVTLADDNEALVNFTNTGRKLTISTCNTFGAKQERWVVESHFYAVK